MKFRLSVKFKIQKYVGYVGHSKWTLWKNHNRNAITSFQKNKRAFKSKSSVKFCWSRELGPWQHSCRMEFIKIPLHTEHMYSPEEVKEEDL